MGTSAAPGFACKSCSISEDRSSGLTLHASGPNKQILNRYDLFFRFLGTAFVRDDPGVSFFRPLFTTSQPTGSHEHDIPALKWGGLLEPREANLSGDNFPRRTNLLSRPEQRRAVPQSRGAVLSLTEPLLFCHGQMLSGQALSRATPTDSTHR